jgi:hypothetical protein
MISACFKRISRFNPTFIHCGTHIDKREPCKQKNKTGGVTMQPVNNNSNASAANVNSNSNAANVNSVNNSNNSNNNSNAAKVKSNGNVDKVSLSKGGRNKSRRANRLGAEHARDTKRNNRNGRNSRGDAAEKAGRAQKSRRNHGRSSVNNQVRVKITKQSGNGVRNLFDKFTEKNTQTIKTVVGNKTESKSPVIDFGKDKSSEKVGAEVNDKSIKTDQVSENSDKKAPVAGEQIVISAPKNLVGGPKAEGNGNVVNIPGPKKEGEAGDTGEGKQVGNVPDLFKEKDNTGNGPVLGIGNNGNDKPNGPPGLLKKEDDDKDKGPVAIGKNKNKNKGPVGVGNQKDKEDKIHGKPDTVKEIKGALSKLRELMEELQEKSKKSKKDSADEQKNYGFGAGMVSLNTSKSFQTSSKPTYGRPIGAAKGSAIHINGGSDSKPGQSGTTIVNNGGFSLGSLTNRAGALSTYSQIQDLG